MKKLIFTLIAFAGINAAMYAQTTTPKVITKTVTTAKPVVTTKMVTAKPVVAKPVVTAVVKPPVVLKKDGTPDKRYKATVTPAGPLKKDGTSDMRYKANKKGKGKS